MKLGFQVEKTKSGYSLDCPVLDIYIYGEQLGEVFSEFEVVFYYFLKYYLNTPDNKLSEKVLNKKRIFEKFE